MMSGRIAGHGAFYQVLFYKTTYPSHDHDRGKDDQNPPVKSINLRWRDLAKQANDGKHIHAPMR